MPAYEFKEIGVIKNNEEGACIQLQPAFTAGLKELEGFSHIQIVWLFSDYIEQEYRTMLTSEQPYKHAPANMGVFATRSPFRPNPIAISVVECLSIDQQGGQIYIPYIDANDGTPLLDIKPYTPSLDRVEAPNVPTWCTHWPKSLEESADFPWEEEFNF